MTTDSQTLKIVFKAWATALLINTILGTAVVTDLYTYAEIVGPVAALGLFYAAVFTSPFVSLLLICLRYFLKMQYSGNRLFTYFFLTGLFLTTGCFTIFFLMIGTTGLPMWPLLLIALGSSAVGMLLEYRPVVLLGLKDGTTDACKHQSSY